VHVKIAIWFYLASYRITWAFLHISSRPNRDARKITWPRKSACVIGCVHTSCFSHVSEFIVSICRLDFTISNTTNAVYKYKRYTMQNDNNIVKEAHGD